MSGKITLDSKDTEKINKALRNQAVADNKKEVDNLYNELDQQIIRGLQQSEIYVYQALCKKSSDLARLYVENQNDLFEDLLTIDGRVEKRPEIMKAKITESTIEEELHRLPYYLDWSSHQAVTFQSLCDSLNQYRKLVEAILYTIIRNYYADKRITKPEIESLIRQQNIIKYIEYRYLIMDILHKKWSNLNNSLRQRKEISNSIISYNNNIIRGQLT